MALTTRTLPALQNGISRQPPLLRSSDQMEDELNTWSKLASGLARRPPTEVVQPLGVLDFGDAAVHHINRDVNERYTVLINTGSIRVFDETTGAEKTVTATDGFGYLDAPGDFYRAVTVADYTFIVNTQKVPQLKAVGADLVEQSTAVVHPGGLQPQHLNSTDVAASGSVLAYVAGANVRVQPNIAGSFTGSVASKEKLPATVCSGCVYEVKGEAETSFVSYYVRGDGSVWNETVRPDLANAINEKTMPHALVRAPDGTFKFAPFAWQHRRVGDAQTNPEPPFIGRPIRDVFFAQNRLGFLVDESAVFSAAGDYGDFWRRTVLDYLDSDTLSASAATSDVNVLDYAVPFSDGLMLFSRQKQFSLTWGDSGLSARSIAIQPVTSYVMSPEVRPIPMGSQVHFAAESAGYVSLQEYTRLAGSDPTEAADVTAHVPGLIPKGVTALLSAPDLDAIFLFTGRAAKPADRRKMFVYQFFWDGDRKLQSAWRVWDFGDGEPLSGAYEGGTLHILIKRPSGFFLERIRLSPEAVSPNQDDLIYLDRQVSMTGVYHAESNRTVYTLPYAPDPDKLRLVRGLGATIPQSLVNPAMVSVVGESVTVEGDESGHPATIGHLYETRVVLSRQYPLDYQGKPLTTGRLQLHNFTVNATDTAHLKAVVYPYGRAADELNPGMKHEAIFSGRILGTPGAVLGRPVYHSGAFTFSVSGNSEAVEVELINDSPFASTLTSAQWEGLYWSRAL